MATSYTDILKLALPATGELAGTWGDVVNQNITSMIEEAIAGLAVVDTWTAGSRTLTVSNGTTSESRCAILELSGAPGQAATVICPDESKIYIVRNDVSGGFAATIKTASGTGVTIPNGKTAAVFCDGLNVSQATDFFATVDIDGGTIDGTAIGATSASTGAFTSLTSSSATTLNGTTIPASKTLVTIDDTQTLSNKTLTSPTVNTPTISGGTINNTPIGGTTASTGAFTTVAASSTVTATKLVPTGNVTAGNGMYLPAANTLAFSTNGSERVRVASSGFVGIGASSPTELLDVNGRSIIRLNQNFSPSTDNTAKTLILSSQGASAGENLLGASISFSRLNTDSPRAAIAAINSDGNFERVGLSFFTHPSATAADPMVEAMRINHLGNVGIGTTSPFGLLDVSKPNGTDIVITNPTNYGTAPGISPTNRVSNGIVWRGNIVTGFGSGSDLAETNFIRSVLEDTTTGSSPVQGRYAMTFGVASGGVSQSAATERMRITSSGNVGIGTSSPTANLQVRSTGFTAVTVESTRATPEQNIGDYGFTDGISGFSGTRGLVGGTLTFLTGVIGSAPERMRITSTGNVGIGTSSPLDTLHVVNTTNPVQMRVGINVAGVSPVIQFTGRKTGTTTNAQAFLKLNSDDLLFTLMAPSTTTPTIDALNIDASGNVGVNVQPESSARFFVEAVAGSQAHAAFFINTRTQANSGTIVIKNEGASGTRSLINFRNAANTEVGRISHDGTSTTYATSSDYRLKENLTPISDALTRVAQIPVYRFNFKADPDKTVDGFVAHELAPYVPEAVTGEKDEMQTEEYQVEAAKGEIFIPAVEEVLDDEGEVVTEAQDEQIIASDVTQPEELPEGHQWRETTPAVMGEREVPAYQGVDQSKLTPLLTAAIQQLLTKVEALEAEVAALKGQA